jgi:Tol biopolymer transport system component
MTPEQWHRMKQIFGGALELELGAREAFARSAAGDDSELLAELLQMLTEIERETGLLSKPVLADAKALSQEEAPRFAPSAVLARRFRIVRFIARGGMGEVYEAEDIELGERVALKAIRRHVAADAELRALFRREVQLARSVTHPNVCRIFDLEQHEDPETGETTLLLSMELIEGQTLAEYLRLNGPLNFRSALPLIEEIAAGLQAVHDAEIVHGDLKPGNVMLAVVPGESAPHARVMDFGMAFRARQGLPTGRGPSPGPPRGGTPDYFAPEQITGEPSTTATDVYALALVIEDMLGVPRSNRLKPDTQQMPSRWARTLRRCLEDDPARRYARPSAVTDALRAALDRKWKTRQAAIAAVCAAAAIALAARGVDVMRGTGNRLLFTEDSSLEVWRASPDGKRLAATSWDTGDLVLTDVNSGRIRRLTHKTTLMQNEYGGTFGAIFSPDGRQIAFEWSNSRRDAEIRLIGIDGKGERTLYHDPDRHASLLDWSPDGSRLLARIVEFSGNAKLAALSVRDGSVQYPKTQPAGVRDGAMLFGSDGDTIVFDTRSLRNEGNEIHRMSFSGDDSVLVGHAGASSIMSWSPDRKRLIFSSDLRGEPGIWAITVSPRGAEGEPRELFPGSKNWDPLGLTRNGFMFYRRDDSSMDVYTAVLDLAAGRTVSPPVRVTRRFVGAYAFPDWSEDGKQLVFASHPDRLNPGVAIYDSRTSQIQELQPGLSFVGRPQWAEQGAAIMAIGAEQGGEHGIFRIDPQSGQARLFKSAKELEAVTEGVWSRDGRFHFNRYTDQRRGVFRLNLASGERMVLYVPPPGVLIGRENLALSPDGKTLAFHARSESAGTGTLMIVPSAGGEARPLLTIKQPEYFPFGSFTWTADSKRVLAVRTRDLNPKQTVSEIWQVPMDGSEPRKVDFPETFFNCLRMSPDGKSIAFQMHRARIEIWVLQNFL